MRYVEVAPIYLGELLVPYADNLEGKEARSVLNIEGGEEWEVGSQRGVEALGMDLRVRGKACENEAAIGDGGEDGFFDGKGGPALGGHLAVGLGEV